MSHLEEMYSRFRAELRAIQAMPRVTPEDADPSFVPIDEAWAELEQAKDSAAFEIAAQKLRNAVAFTHEVCKSKAALWASYESAYSSLQIGINDALKRDKLQL